MTKNIYELTRLQYDTLVFAANDSSPVFAVLEPCDSDYPERRKMFVEQAKEMDDLVTLDILKDESERFRSAITECEARTGRGYKVLSLTEAGKQMFIEADNRRVN